MCVCVCGCKLHGLSSLTLSLSASPKAFANARCRLIDQCKLCKCTLINFVCMSTRIFAYTYIHTYSTCIPVALFNIKTCCDWEILLSLFLLRLHCKNQFLCVHTSHTYICMYVHMYHECMSTILRYFFVVLCFLLLLYADI